MKNSLDGSGKRWRVVGIGHALDYPANLAANSKTGAEEGDVAALQKMIRFSESHFAEYWHFIDEQQAFVTIRSSWLLKNDYFYCLNTVYAYTFFPNFLAFDIECLWGKSSG